MTIRELALKLGLSKTSVSDALRGRPWVAEKTRQRVRDQAKALGYEPNPVASVFIQQIRSKDPKRYRANLAFLSPGANRDTPWFQGAAARAAELGYGMDLINWREYNSASLTRVLLARGVLGVVASPLARPIGHLTLDWSRFACVALGYSMVRPALDRVVHNHLQGLRLTFRFCRRQGFRRIGLAMKLREGDARSNGLWSSGYMGLQQTLPTRERVKPFLVEDALYTPGRIAAWLRSEKPDAVIFHTFPMVPRLPQFYRSASIAAVVLDFWGNCPFPGVDQRYERLGARAVDQLALQILHNIRGLPAEPTITMIDGSWVEGPEKC